MKEVHICKNKEICVLKLMTYVYCCVGATQPEAEFLDGIGTKVLRVFLLGIHTHLC